MHLPLQPPDVRLLPASLKEQFMPFLAKGLLLLTGILLQTLLNFGSFFLL